MAVMQYGICDFIWSIRGTSQIVDDNIDVSLSGEALKKWDK